LSRVAPDGRILKNISLHLDGLADEVTDIELVVSEIMAPEQVSVSNDVVQNLQRFDALSQSLRDLSRLVMALAVRGEDRAVGLKTLQLGATRDLLNGTRVNGTSDGGSEQAGSIDLF